MDINCTYVRPYEIHMSGMVKIYLFSFIYSSYANTISPYNRRTINVLVSLDHEGNKKTRKLDIYQAELLYNAELFYAYGFY